MSFFISNTNDNLQIIKNKEVKFLNKKKTTSPVVKNYIFYDEKIKLKY